MERAILEGSEVTLATDLINPKFWQQFGYINVKGKTHRRKIDSASSSKRFALTEFNTCYVRGFLED
jgi:hypothetical protein